MSTTSPDGKVSRQRLVHLARHGQTAYNLDRRFQGQLEVPLDDTGREQAIDLAQRAATHGFRALWTSPLLRARETTSAVAQRLGLAAREDPRLMETDAGDWTDLTFAEVQERSPEAFQSFIDGDPDFSFPGGESFAEQGLRVAAALRDVELGDLPALVICHGVVIRIALYQRAGHRVSLARRIPNAALIPLDPAPGGAPTELAACETPRAPNTAGPTSG